MPFKKGHKYSKGRKLGSKNQETIKKEELRQKFEDFFMSKWKELLLEQFNEARKNSKARHYVFDQVIGKPRETISMSGGPTVKLDIL